MSDYVFDNAGRESSTRLSVLESRYDHASRGCFRRLGIGPGWRCLDVGGGGGSLAGWLADRVGPTGEVVVTDVEPRWTGDLTHRRNVRPIRHDVARDPLPDGEFDLIHARLVLARLPERHDVLTRLVKALRPGGWLLLEEFDCTWVPVLTAPSAAEAVLFEDVHESLMRLLRDAGAEPRWGREIFGALLAAGLADVAATTFSEAWQGGGAGIGLHRATTEQVRDRLSAYGVDELRLRDFWRLLADPAFAVGSYPLVSAWGRRA